MMKYKQEALAFSQGEKLVFLKIAFFLLSGFNCMIFLFIIKKYIKSVEMLVPTIFRTTQRCQVCADVVHI